MAVHRINLEAAPDPNAGTDMRKRGNPELYSCGEKDHNRVWRESCLSAQQVRKDFVLLTPMFTNPEAGHGNAFWNPGKIWLWPFTMF